MGNSLIINNVKVSPGSASPNTQVTVTVNLTNNTGVQQTFWLNGFPPAGSGIPTMDFKYIFNISANQTTEVSDTFIVPQLYYQVSAFLKVNIQTYIINSQNNDIPDATGSVTLITTAPQTLPTFSINNLVISPTSPKVGDVVSISVDIANTSSVNTSIDSAELLVT